MICIRFADMYAMAIKINNCDEKIVGNRLAAHQGAWNR